MIHKQKLAALRRKYDLMLLSYYKKNRSDLSEHFETEDAHRNALMRIIGGNKEVKTPVGKIDIINNDLVVECKFASTHKNKAAIGQALCYTYYYPGYVPAVALIGKPSPIVETVCDDYGLLVFWYWGNRWLIQ